MSSNNDIALDDICEALLKSFMDTVLWDSALFRKYFHLIFPQHSWDEDAESCFQRIPLIAKSFLEDCKETCFVAMAGGFVECLKAKLVCSHACTNGDKRMGAPAYVEPMCFSLRNHYILCLVHVLLLRPFSS